MSEKLIRASTAIAGGVTGIALSLIMLRLTVADEFLPPLAGTDPCEGQTDEQCHATIDSLRSEFATKYVSWVNEYIASGQDPRILTRSPINAVPAEPVQSLTSAVTNADAIIVGSVIDVVFKAIPPDEPGGFPFVSSTAVVAVEETIKGTAEKDISLLQWGGPQPNPDWTGGRLSYLEAAPILLQGDKALLFLIRDESGYAYWAAVWTGTYTIDAESKVHALAGNPFADSVEGQALSEFSNDVRVVVAQQSTPAQ